MTISKILPGSLPSSICGLLVVGDSDSVFSGSSLNINHFSRVPAVRKLKSKRRCESLGEATLAPSPDSREPVDFLTLPGKDPLRCMQPACTFAFGSQKWVMDSAQGSVWRLREVGLLRMIWSEDFESWAGQLKKKILKVGYNWKISFQFSIEDKRQV